MANGIDPVNMPLPAREQAMKRYEKKRLWGIVGIAIILTIVSIFLPFTMFRDVIKPDGPTGSGCNCTYQFGGFPVPFVIHGTDALHISMLISHARALVVNSMPESFKLGCTPSCVGVMAIFVPFIVLDAVLLFVALFFTDYLVFKTGRKNRYWVLLFFIAVYIAIYILASPINAYDYPGQMPRL